MLPQTTSIWQRDSQPNASGKPGAVQIEEVFGWVKSAAGQDKTWFSGAGSGALRLHIDDCRLQSCQASQAAGDGVMVAHAALVGKWRIVESGTWPRDQLDLCGPAFLRINAEGTGEMAFGALCASIASGFTPSGVEFEWNGADEGDQVRGTGWADLREDGCLEGEVAYTTATIPPSSPNRGLFSGLLDQPVRPKIWCRQGYAGPSVINGFDYNRSQRAYFNLAETNMARASDPCRAINPPKKPTVAATPSKARRKNGGSLMSQW
jgi:hypothetical protein